MWGLDSVLSYTVLQLSFPEKLLCTLLSPNTPVALFVL